MLTTAAFAAAAAAAVVGAPAEAPTCGGPGGHGSSAGALADTATDEPDFLAAVPDRLKCPICLGHLKAPLQTCCGHRFCRSCFFSAAAAAAAAATTPTGGGASQQQSGAAASHSATRKACPLCRSPILDVGSAARGLTAAVFNDLATEREVQQLSVRCPRPGCGVELELGALRNHLANVCQFVEEACPEQCQSRVRRCDLAAHRAACRDRQVLCPFCTLAVPYRQLNFHYLFSCPNFPVPCPQRCGRVLAGPQRLQEHLDRTCPLSLVLCPFASCGCPAASRHRRDLGRHVAEAHSFHLQLLWQQQQQQQAQSQQQQRATTAELNCMLDKLVVNLQQAPIHLHHHQPQQQLQLHQQQQQQQAQAAALRSLIYHQQQQQQQQQHQQQQQQHQQFQGSSRR